MEIQDLYPSIVVKGGQARCATFCTPRIADASCASATFQQLQVSLSYWTEELLREKSISHEGKTSVFFIFETLFVEGYALFYGTLV